MEELSAKRCGKCNTFLNRSKIADQGYAWVCYCGKTFIWDNPKKEKPTQEPGDVFENVRKLN